MMRNFLLVGAVLAAAVPPQDINLARAGTATQSSTSYGGVATMAIDGNRDGNHFSATPSVTHTAGVPGDWWQVVLPVASVIHEVAVFNRSDCCGQRFGNLRLEVHNDATPVFRQEFFTNGGALANGRVVRVLMPAPGVVGNRVRITKFAPTAGGEHYLSLAEVEVIRYGALREVNLAPYGTATSSSVGVGAQPPGAAIDGLTDGFVANGSTTWTDSAAGSWWRVALPLRSLVHRVRLFNRTDSALARCSNLRVDVFDGASVVFTRDLHIAGTWVPAAGETIDLPAAGVQCTHVVITARGPGATQEQVVQLAEVEVIQLVPTAAQGASWVPFGASCEATGGAPVLAIRAGTRPALGTTFTVEVANAGRVTPGVYAAFFITGASNSASSLGPLPWFSGFGGPGCWLLASMDVVIGVTGASSTLALPLTVPLVTSLGGAVLYQQAGVIDAATPYPFDLVFSNAGRVTLGR